ncbi:hypothetical protein [Holdemania massiliensis]|uniref:hypothetical protein n=1 Tax=Holdemania massiliensis TaxID=1468449 RepID=UPI001F053DDA|nr:hypothetical protein [Holdemania massiliensis]MCH1941618.1 hypothetical protein [Holdemania massiliensis]
MKKKQQQQQPSLDDEIYRELTIKRLNQMTGKKLKFAYKAVKAYDECPEPEKTV